MPLIPVLEIGGTHVTAGVVDLGPLSRVRRHQRQPLDSHASASDILATLVAAGRSVDPPDGAWAVAMPGPFDYAAGVGTFEGAGKFEHLIGFGLGSALSAHLPGATGVRFLNDAHAFALGEDLIGAAAGYRRSMVLTIGTGIGVGFVEDGHLVTDERVPPKGEFTMQMAAGHPTEHWMSRRALLRRHKDAGGDESWDVRELAAAALAGDAAARANFELGYGRLAEIAAPVVESFQPECIVVGGTIARSWELVEDFFAAPLAAAAGRVPVVGADEPDHSPLVGAAAYAIWAAGPLA